MCSLHCLCSNIPQKDQSDIPDPYVKLYLLPERAKDTKRKTQVIKDNCDPVFDETFEYVLSQGELHTKQLEVTVASQKQLFYGSGNVLGMVSGRRVRGGCDGFVSGYYRLREVEREPAVHCVVRFVSRVGVRALKVLYLWGFALSV